MKVTIGEFTKIKTGKLDANAAVVGGEYPFFTCSKEPLRINTYTYDCECILVAGNGDLNVKYYKGKFEAYQRTYIIEDNSGGKLYMPYLYYFMEKYIEELREKSIGGVIKYIKLGNLTDKVIDLPDMNKQKEIVDILSTSQKIIELYEREIKKFEEIIKARFVEMFGDPVSNEKQWDKVKLSVCLERIDNGKSFICDNQARSGDYPAILKLSAATYGIYIPEENKALLNENQFVESVEVHAGDLLFTRKNTPELVGMAAYVYQTPEKLMMPDLIFRLVTNEKMNPVFLWQLINNREFRTVIQSVAGGSAKSMSNISKERLNNIYVICPPKEVQNSYREIIDQVNKSKVVVQKALDEAQTLFDSLMQEYFG